MLVVCINNSGTSLIKGNVYKVISVEEDFHGIYYDLSDNNRIFTACGSFRFKLLSELRKSKLKKIC